MSVVNEIYKMEPNEGSSWKVLRRGMFEGPEDEANEEEEMSSGESEDEETEESEEMVYINLCILTPAVLKNYKFANPEAAYKLYYGFGLYNGFCARKNSAKVCYHSFVCCREGRHDHQRDHGPVIRCGCTAQIRIRLDQDSGLWYVAYLNNDHNHPLVDIPKMNSIVEKLEDIDAQNAIKYLYSMAFEDLSVFWRYKVNSNGLLSHLFWSDSTCQLEYQTFGDVLAIDATYKMNKFKYRLVVFSGANHHNKICVFGSAIVSDESEETYVWLLQQFLEMKGKSPQLVITNGDGSMRNAINSVFPQAQHRLCSWNLTRNAAAKARQTRFTDLFKECMTDDSEIREWEDKWKGMVKECGVNHIKWVQDMYEKKHMWANAYIKGNFFAGFRTSSRCEGLIRQVNKFDQPRSSLAQLLINFQHCLENMRQKELKDDFNSFNSVPVLLTVLEPLEKFGASVYTRDIFYMYRSLLLKSYAMIVMLEPKKTASSTIYTVREYLKPSLNWTVSFNPEKVEFRCSCFHLETFGIPCGHIIKVMASLHMTELPKSLVLNRWTKNAKKGVESPFASKSDNDLNGKRKRVACESSQLAKKHGDQIGTSAECEERIGDTAVAESKGCGGGCHFLTTN